MQSYFFWGGGFGVATKNTFWCLQRWRNPTLNPYELMSYRPIPTLSFISKWNQPTVTITRQQQPLLSFRAVCCAPATMSDLMLLFYMTLSQPPIPVIVFSLFQKKKGFHWQACLCNGSSLTSLNASRHSPPVQPFWSFGTDNSLIKSTASSQAQKIPLNSFANAISDATSSQTICARPTDQRQDEGWVSLPSSAECLRYRHVPVHINTTSDRRDQDGAHLVRHPSQTWPIVSHRPHMAGTGSTVTQPTSSASAETTELSR